MEGTLKVNWATNRTVEATWRENRRGAGSLPKEPTNIYGTRVKKKDRKLRVKDFKLRLGPNGSRIDQIPKLIQRALRLGPKAVQAKEFCQRAKRTNFGRESKTKRQTRKTDRKQQRSNQNLKTSPKVRRRHFVAVKTEANVIGKHEPKW